MTATETQPRRSYFYRHSIVVRVTHWVNVLCMTVLLMSGLQIFNAHPALYLGEISDVRRSGLRDGRGARAVTASRSASPRSSARRFETTGVLGLSKAGWRRLAARGFPSWITLPSYQDLATGRRWHFFFAWLFVINGLVYVGSQRCDRPLAADSFRPARSFATSAASIREHLLAALSEGRGGEVLQCPSEARLFRRDRRRSCRC